MNSIGVAPERSGVGIEAIRYYEREGVVPAADRQANGLSKEMRGYSKALDRGLERASKAPSVIPTVRVLPRFNGHK